MYDNYCILLLTTKLQVPGITSILMGWKTGNQNHWNTLSSKSNSSQRLWASRTFDMAWHVSQQIRSGCHDTKSHQSPEPTEPTEPTSLANCCVISCCATKASADLHNLGSKGFSGPSLAFRKIPSTWPSKLIFKCHNVMMMWCSLPIFVHFYTSWSCAACDHGTLRPGADRPGYVVQPPAWCQH